ncbi:hypothetical protein AAVH_19680 [Aphelenchoides avenae]|nr:hypothetical protein AAVH_19680 [Aphelenchus avenae]
MSILALLPCRAHFAADAVCDLRSFSIFGPNIFHRALSELFMCNTLVFAFPDPGNDFHRYGVERGLAALPCLADCAKLQIADYHRAFFDANGALEWLLGTHSATTSAKDLSIEEIDRYYWDDFPTAFIVAIEQQFIQATTPTSFNVDLLFFVGLGQRPDVGATRELENANTNEQLTIVVDTDVRKPNGKPSYKTKVAILRKPSA